MLLETHDSPEHILFYRIIIQPEKDSEKARSDFYTISISIKYFTWNMYIAPISLK